MNPDDTLLKECADLIFSTWREDGRFKLYPNGGIYPCHTANAANVLCHMGYASDIRMQKTFQHFLDTQYTDGGWRCNKFSFGRGPETEYSNPLPTLNILNAFRFSNYLNKESKLDKAVDFLLDHWTIKKPIGLVTMELEPYLCKLNILSVIITYSFMSTFYHFIIVQKRIIDF